jgi:hypothetical protein
MRTKRSSVRRYWVFILVAGAHTYLILILAHRHLIESRDETVADVSMAMILIPPTDRRTPEHKVRAKVTAAHPLPAAEPMVEAATAIHSTPSPVSPNNTINWDLARQSVASSMALPPKRGIFDAPPRSEAEESHRAEPPHSAGESYRDVYGDTIVWISESCYIVSEAPELGIPEAFKRVQPTRVRCIRQGPAEGELFKDLPEYQKRHPQ